jgi:hypothetical protein
MRRAALVIGLLLVAPASSTRADPDDEVVGTAHPGLVEASSPDGRWVVICQARRDTDRDGRIETFAGQHGRPVGDELEAYLVLGHGEGVPITRYLGADDAARWVHAETSEGSTLFDTRDGSRSSLEVPHGESLDPAVVEDRVSFDFAGEHALLARRVGEPAPRAAGLFLRDLATGSERAIDPGPGLLVDWALSANGRWVVATVVTRDTTGDGRLDSPHVGTDLYEGGCATPISSYSTWGSTGDAVSTRLLSVEGSFSRDVPGFLGMLGDRWLVRDPDAALVVESPSERRVVAAPRQRAYVLARRDEAGEALVAASEGAAAGRVLVVGAREPRPLEAQVTPPTEDETRRREGPVTPLGWWSANAYDWTKHALVPLRGNVLASWRSRVLFSRWKLAYVLDLRDDGETEVGAQVERPWWDDRRQAGRFLLLDGTLFDLHLAKAVGHDAPFQGDFPTDRPATLALRDDGRVLRASGPSATSYALPPGPFRWTTLPAR